MNMNICFFVDVKQLIVFLCVFVRSIVVCCRHHPSEAREQLKKERGIEYSYPVLAFHGTAVANIQPICEKGFKVPGQ
jgi:hypothetical protein